MLLGFAIILVGGFLSGRVLRRLGLPALLGALVLGIVAGPYSLNMLPEALLKAAADLRMIALTIILLRAGLGLSRALLAQVGPIALRMSLIPCLLEGGVATLAAMRFLRLPLAEAGMLGFILASVSPVVVVPLMLSLKSAGLGMDKGIPVMILAGAALNGAFAVTIFSAFLSLGSHGTLGNPLQVSFQLLWSVLGGALMGFVACALFQVISRFFVATKVEDSLIVLGLTLAAVAAGDLLAYSGPLAALVLGFALIERSPKQANQVEQHLADLWVGAQMMLFVLMGAAVQLPLLRVVGFPGLTIIALGLVARSSGVFAALLGSNLNMRERYFSCIAYTPKASIQAAIGGIPLALGFASGQTILAVAALSIVSTAPLGTIAVDKLAPHLLKATGTDLSAFEDGLPTPLTTDGR